jgi:predicted nuclease of predicted toxin-antitoxin system
VNFLVDSQLPPALARWIEAQGHSALHVADLGMAAEADNIVWQHALANNAVVVSKDFVDRWLLHGEEVPLVWIRKGNCSNRALVEWIAPLWPEAVSRLARGERFVELRA